MKKLEIAIILMAGPFMALSCAHRPARSNTPSTYQVGAALDTANEQTLYVQKSLASGSTALRGVSQGLSESRSLSQRIDDKAVVLLKHWK